MMAGDEPSGQGETENGFDRSPARTVSIELELELDYVGLSDREIRDRCFEDQEAITKAIRDRMPPVLPACLKAFRLRDRGAGEWFPQNPGPNTAGS